MNRRQKLLREISAARFAEWELHLYLDTHPSDMRAAALRAEYEKKADKLTACFEEEFGPLTAPEGEGAEWLKNPWPWDIERCD